VLFASHVGHNVIRKEEKIAYIVEQELVMESNISCDSHLLNELLETDVEFECVVIMPSWCRQVN
jgi:hypothetical protein